MCEKAKDLLWIPATTNQVVVRFAKIAIFVHSCSFCGTRRYRMQICALTAVIANLRRVFLNFYIRVHVPRRWESFGSALRRISEHKYIFYYKF